MYLLLYLTTCRDAVVNSDDENRENIDPDKLRNGLKDYILSSDKTIVYEFFARYVRKVYSDCDIKTDLKIMKAYHSLTRLLQVTKCLLLA